MHKALAVFVSGLSLATLCTAPNAQDLPKSGSINIHTGWKLAGEQVDVAQKLVQGHGSVVGASFNDKGSGPLHGGPATCFYTFFATESGTKNKGYCAFGDADGDRIFTDWSGTGDEGINQIAGGTGKYAGIKGSGPWKCKTAGPNGQYPCTQQFNYQLP